MFLHNVRTQDPCMHASKYAYKGCNVSHSISQSFSMSTLNVILAISLYKVNLNVFLLFSSGSTKANPLNFMWSMCYAMKGI